MTRTTPTNPFGNWEADLGDGYLARVHLEGGYGMTYINLELLHSDQRITHAQSYTSGTLWADSRQIACGYCPDTELSRRQYESLSISASGAEGAISCTYNFF